VGWASKRHGTQSIQGFNEKQTFPYLVGGFNPTPLKNDGVRQLG
jgi:hypothetical protein